MGVVVLQVRPVCGRRWQLGGAEGPRRGRPLPRCGQHLDLQSVQGGGPQIGHREDAVLRRQDLGLRDEAVGQAVLSALGRHLRPRHLEAGHRLVEVGLGRLPREVACDVGVLDEERRGQVLRLGQHFGRDTTCVLQAADELVAFSLEGRTRWSHKEHGFWLRAALRPAWLDSHFIFAGK